MKSFVYTYKHLCYLSTRYVHIYGMSWSSKYVVFHELPIIVLCVL